MTQIEWTERTWNPVTGCDRVSDGCTNCYALTMAKRLKGMGSAKYQRDGDPKTSGPGFGVSMHPDTLAEPFKWRKPRKVFVNSMSDLFHKDITDEFIDEVFGVMAVAHAMHGHTFQVLTKRHARMRSYLTKEFRTLKGGYTGSTRTAIANAAHRWAIDRINAGALSDAIEFGEGQGGGYGAGWPLPGVWLGVSVEDQHWADIRIPALMSTPAAIRFLSCEPLLGPIDLTRFALPDWVIVGGESGRNARPIDPSWVRDLRDQCTNAYDGPPGITAFFFKQWGGIRPKSNGRELDGRTWDEYPQ